MVQGRQTPSQRARRPTPHLSALPARTADGRGRATGWAPAANPTQTRKNSSCHSKTRCMWRGVTAAAPACQLRGVAAVVQKWRASGQCLRLPRQHLRPRRVDNTEHYAATTPPTCYQHWLREKNTATTNRPANPEYLDKYPLSTHGRGGRTGFATPTLRRPRVRPRLAPPASLSARRHAGWAGVSGKSGGKRHRR